MKLRLKGAVLFLSFVALGASAQERHALSARDAVEYAKKEQRTG